MSNKKKKKYYIKTLLTRTAINILNIDEKHVFLIYLVINYYNICRTFSKFSKYIKLFYLKIIWNFFLMWLLCI